MAFDCCEMQPVVKLSRSLILPHSLKNKHSIKALYCLEMAFIMVTAASMLCVNLIYQSHIDLPSDYIHSLYVNTDPHVHVTKMN